MKEIHKVFYYGDFTWKRWCAFLGIFVELCPEYISTQWQIDTKGKRWSCAGESVFFFGGSCVDVWKSGDGAAQGRIWVGD